MRLFNWISKRDEASASKEEAVDTPIESQSTGDILLQALLKGETINKNKAMSIPAVSSAVDRISNMVAMLPIRLYREEITDGKRKVVEVLKDGRTKLLNQDTGDTLDPFQLKKAMARDYLIEKGAYIYLEKSKNEFKSIIKGTTIGFIPFNDFKEKMIISCPSLDKQNKLAEQYNNTLWTINALTKQLEDSKAKLGNIFEESLSEDD